ncbi:MAG TPA: methyl-accepting chemotaxis protein, partial [Caulobacteraceae bacterium]|nr:methyl-accepting chemotaxis protein [Caulobacteraceae bacterium]
MKSLRFADLSIMVKMALAPAFAVIVLAAVSAGGFYSQQLQGHALDRVVQHDMSVSLKLAAISKRITAAHLQIYQLLTEKAQNAASSGSPEKVQALLGEVDSIKTDLAKLKANIPASQQANFAKVTKDLTDYRGGIEVVGSMLGVDFNTAASFVAPFEQQYSRMTSNLDGAVKAVQADSAAAAAKNADDAKAVGQVVLGGSLLTLLAVVGMSMVSILGVKRGISDIAGATEKLAGGDHGVDTDKLQRKDELGAIVRGLAVFKDNQQRLAAMRREQEESQAREAAMREQVERERAKAQEEQAHVVRALADGLSQ